MIQRIQSIYLLISFITSALLLFLPLSEYTIAGETYKLFVGGINPSLESSPNTWPLLVLTALVGILSIYCIFQYKNRSFQLKINTAAMFLNLFLVVAIFYYSDQMLKIENTSAEFKNLFATYLPVISVLAIILANRGIRKDENLLKKSDRLR